jgi:hypothetical protein
LKGYKPYINENVEEEHDLVRYINEYIKLGYKNAVWRCSVLAELVVNARCA